MISVGEAFTFLDIVKFIRRRLLHQLKSASQPEVAFHYTNAQGILGILRSRAIWATHIEYLNDTVEFTYARELATEVISQLPDKAGAALHSRFRSCFLEGIRRRRSRDINVFVTSFSARGDSLSQWRGYGANIGGYAIGFPLEKLDAITGGQLLHDHQLVNKQGIFLTPCWYDEREQRQLVLDWFAEMPNILRRNLRRGVDEDLGVSDERLSDFATSMLASIAPAFKHPSFADEAEWRLVVDLNSSGLVPTPEVLIRAGQATLVPYVSIPLADDTHPLQLSKIVIGPTPHPELTHRALSREIERLGCKVGTIVNSSSPFRSL